MKFASLSDLIEATRGAVDIDGAVTIKDPAAFRGDLMDRLTHTAVFGAGDVRDAARWLIWEGGQALGIQSASIDALYRARARGEYEGMTVPAINVRAMAYDFARAIVSSAHKAKVGAFIFELARSEMEYTEQDADEFATVMMAAAIREGHTGPIFIQGDHFQANAKKYTTDPEGVLEGLRTLIRSAITAGYGNIDIDTSTLVDLSFATEREQQRHNYEPAAELAALIRKLEPTGTTISIGGEIGEVGKNNSTVAELRAYMEGFNEEFARRAGGSAVGLSKVSVNTGSSHGGVVLPDGSIAKVKIDFETLRELSAFARQVGMGGAVQHGASTLPAEAFGKFPEVGTVEVHLATEFQNIMLDGGAFPGDLKREMYAYCTEKLGHERSAGDTEEQFIYKTRKKLWGPFKQHAWTMPHDARASVRGLLEDKLTFLYEKLGATNSEALVARHVKGARIDKPRPEALKGVPA
ncbi:MAG: class II fructose-bisphosphate aldolase [Chloroflexi bacterium]|nr:class II fructose-bisphosphate aldolase [Chloroflexota bacterium]